MPKLLQRAIEILGGFAEDDIKLAGDAASSWNMHFTAAACGVLLLAARAAEAFQIVPMTVGRARVGMRQASCVNRANALCVSMLDGENSALRPVVLCPAQFGTAVRL